MGQDGQEDFREGHPVRGPALGGRRLSAARPADAPHRQPDPACQGQPQEGHRAPAACPAQAQFHLRGLLGRRAQGLAACRVPALCPERHLQALRLLHRVDFLAPVGRLVQRQGRVRPPDRPLLHGPAGRALLREWGDLPVQAA